MKGNPQLYLIIGSLSFASSFICFIDKCDLLAIILLGISLLCAIRISDLIRDE